MPESITLDDQDLALVEALQIAPRAPWPAVAAAAGVSSATAVRRWRRLAESGAAWIIGTPGVGVWSDRCLAYVDIGCTPSSKLAVAQTLSGDAHALSVELTAGGSDLLLTLAAPDLHTLGRYLLERLDRVSGISSTRTRIATRLYTEGSSWRVGAMTANQAASLSQYRSVPGVPAPPAWLDEVDREFLVALGEDGRASYAELAQRGDVSPATARRHVQRLVVSGAVLLRTELAAPLAGWPISVVLSADAPAGRLDEVCRRIGRIRQVRLCATLAGTPSMIVVAWLRAVDEVHRFELALGKGVPDLTIVDRRIVLRTVKRMGKLLGPDGRATSTVPMDTWSDPIPEAG